MDFEFLDHDEALSVFRSPRPSDSLDELEKLAVRERMLKETGDYPPSYAFRFETHNTFSLEGLSPPPITDMFEEEVGGFSDTRPSESLGEPRPLISGPLEENPWENEVAKVCNKADEEEEEKEDDDDDNVSR